MDRGPYRVRGSVLPDRQLLPEQALPTVIVMQPRQACLEDGVLEVDEFEPVVATLGAPAVALDEINASDSPAWVVRRGTGALLNGLGIASSLVAVAAVFLEYWAIALVAAIAVLFTLIPRMTRPLLRA